MIRDQGTSTPRGGANLPPPSLRTHAVNEVPLVVGVLLVKLTKSSLHASMVGGSVWTLF